MPVYNTKVLTKEQLTGFFSDIKAIKTKLEDDQTKFQKGAFTSTIWDYAVKKINSRISDLKTQFSDLKQYLEHSTIKGNSPAIHEVLHKCFHILKEIFYIAMQEAMIDDATPGHINSFVIKFIELSKSYYELVKTKYDEYEDPKKVIRDEQLEITKADKYAVDDTLDKARGHRKTYEKDIYAVTKLIRYLESQYRRPDIDSVTKEYLASAVYKTLNETRKIPTLFEKTTSTSIHEVDLDSFEAVTVLHSVKMYADKVRYKFTEAVESINQKWSVIHPTRSSHWRSMYKIHIVPLKQQFISGLPYTYSITDMLAKGSVIMENMACDFALPDKFCDTYVSLADAYIDETTAMIEAVSSMEAQLTSLRDEQRDFALKVSALTRTHGLLIQHENNTNRSYSAILVPLGDVEDIVRSQERLRQYPSTTELVFALLEILNEAQQYLMHYQATVEAQQRSIETIVAQTPASREKYKQERSLRHIPTAPAITHRRPTQLRRPADGRTLQIASSRAPGHVASHLVASAPPGLTTHHRTEVSSRQRVVNPRHGHKVASAPLHVTPSSAHSVVIESPQHGRTVSSASLFATPSDVRSIVMENPKLRQDSGTMSGSLPGTQRDGESVSGTHLTY
jgi:hypothetical protein